MTGWLDPLRAVLDTAAAPVTFFLRDDDAGWCDERLWQLLDRLEAVGPPIDLAVIPDALTSDLARRLRARAGAGGGRIGVHQHGWAHVNHEPEGRKSEFGPSRAADDQRRDLVRGRERLRDHLGGLVSDVFVPPWERCTATTARLAAEVGFKVLSRDLTAGTVDAAGLVELPVTVDWFAKHPGGWDGRVDAGQRGALLAGAAASGLPVGVLLHHELMPREHLDRLAELAALLVTHPGAVLRRMEEIAQPSSSGTDPPTPASAVSTSPRWALPFTRRRTR